VPGNSALLGDSNTYYAGHRTVTRKSRGPIALAVWSVRTPCTAQLRYSGPNSERIWHRHDLYYLGSRDGIGYDDFLLSSWVDQVVFNIVISYAISRDFSILKNYRQYLYFLYIYILYFNIIYKNDRISTIIFI